MAPPLSELEVLVLDCQATAPAPRGQLLEIGWARAGATASPARTCLIRPPADGRIPAAVARITGISERMLRLGVDAHAAWLELANEAARLIQQPAPTVVHFARFELPFLCGLAGGAPPLDIVCTHDIARRLLPQLPRRSLRALTGYFGRGVSTPRRSGSHVEATAFVWRELLPLLQAEGVSTWTALHEWLAATVVSTKRATRVWPLPREVRLSLPDTPGVYRMHRTSGDVLYVGKASSLHHRVNSYFRQRSGVPERMLEMLSQVRAISFEVASTPLEAALLEPDEIKRLRPAYNVALGVEDRALWFAAPDLSQRSLHPSSRCPLGPFPSADVIDRFAALAMASRAALTHGRRGPDAGVFEAGFARLCAAHRELSRVDLGTHARLLRLATRLWREGRRDGDGDGSDADGANLQLPVWTAEHVQVELEWLALRAGLARRRARWLTRLTDATLVWSEPGEAAARLIAIENGEITVRRGADPGDSPPVPRAWRRSIAARREGFTVARFDRLKVLTTELKRLVAAGAPVAVRLGDAPALAGARLARVLAWL